MWMSARGTQRTCPDRSPSCLESGVLRTRSCAVRRSFAALLIASAIAPEGLWHWIGARRRRHRAPVSPNCRRCAGVVAHDTIEHLEKVGVDLYLDQQHIDNTTPMGKLLFQVRGAFAEFERSMIRQRIRAGLNIIKDKIARDGKFESKAGIVRTRLGRPCVESEEPKKIERARLELAKGTGIIKTAKLIGLGVGTVHRLKRELGCHAAH